MTTTGKRKGSRHRVLAQPSRLVPGRGGLIGSRRASTRHRGGAHPRRSRWAAPEGAPREARSPRPERQPGSPLDALRGCSGPRTSSPRACPPRASPRAGRSAPMSGSGNRGGCRARPHGFAQREDCSSTARPIGEAARGARVRPDVRGTSPLRLLCERATCGVFMRSPWPGAAPARPRARQPCAWLAIGSAGLARRPGAFPSFQRHWRLRRQLTTVARRIVPRAQCTTGNHVGKTTSSSGGGCQVETAAVIANAATMSGASTFT